MARIVSFKCNVCGKVEDLPFLVRNGRDAGWYVPVTPQEADMYRHHVCSRECAVKFMTPQTREVQP